MKSSSVLLFLQLIITFCQAKSREPKLFTADNPYFQYTGRVDFTNALQPRFWSPGVYLKARFRGNTCHVLINDEVLYGKEHNYIEIVIDDETPIRVQTTGKINDFTFECKSGKNTHTITICKDTEASIGYLDFIGLQCEALLKPPARPKRKIEYIGDSMTTGSGMDMTKIACGKGSWYDQHNAYLSYGPLTSRALNAQWQITAVAGIGMIHSCCNMDIVMPEVFGKLSLRENKINWDFSRYQPNVVTVCLGQNDGVQDSTAFCTAYVKFINTVRADYPKADIICLTSPMGDEKLTLVLKKYLTAVTSRINNDGDKKVYKYFFSKRYYHGCGTHPDMDEHMEIAEELTAYIRSVERW